MQSLNNLPDVGGRRFGNVSIGYDRVDQIRTEISALETLAALLLGCDREALTVANVQALTTSVQSRAAALAGEDLTAQREYEPVHWLAMAVALRA